MNTTAGQKPFAGPDAEKTASDGSHSCTAELKRRLDTVADSLEEYLPDWESLGRVELCEDHGISPSDEFYTYKVTRHYPFENEVFYVSRAEWNRRERARAALRKAGRESGVRS